MLTFEELKYVIGVFWYQWLFWFFVVRMLNDFTC